MYPIRIIDDGNKIESDLAKNWLRFVVETNRGDDRIVLIYRLEKLTMEFIVLMQDITVFPFFVKIGKVHDIFQNSFYLGAPFTFDKASILLGEKGRWLNRMCMDFKTSDFLCRKISLKHVRCKDL
jgi:hypothetical protein